MSGPDQGLDMDLSSGIAAFEAKYFARALQLLTPLAEAGDPEAQYRVAVMAQNGLGLVRNPALAARYMAAAAAANHGLAQHGMGFMALYGECMPQDLDAAVIWLRKAAAQGLAGAQAMLGQLYAEGRGVEQDLEESRRWYRMAGFEDAELTIADAQGGVPPAGEQ